jgi:hypothetical protein
MMDRHSRQEAVGKVISAEGPPVRPERVKEARVKMVTGEYERPEVIDALVELLLGSLITR